MTSWLPTVNCKSLLSFILPHSPFTVPPLQCCSQGKAGYKSVSRHGQLRDTIEVVYLDLVRMVAEYKCMPQTSHICLLCWKGSEIPLILSSLFSSDSALACVPLLHSGKTACAHRLYWGMFPKRSRYQHTQLYDYN